MYVNFTVEYDYQLVSDPKFESNSCTVHEQGNISSSFILYIYDHEEGEWDRIQTVRDEEAWLNGKEGICLTVAW